MKLTLALIVLSILMILPIKAAYLTDVPQQITQPDGTKINCLASGDEFHNWLHDSENYTIIQDKKTGWYSYAAQDGETVVPTDYIVGRVNPHETGLRPGLNISENLYTQRRDAWWSGVSRSHRTPTEGLINNLVVFIRFSDDSEFTELISDYNTMFNSTTPNVNSMHNYFQEDSYQALSISTTFYPLPMTNQVLSYQDSHPRSYFMPYSAINPNGYSSDTERRLREHTLLQNAIQFIEPSVPADLVIDADQDGRVDNVCFIVKGSSGAWADLLWPHMWVLYSFDVYLNGSIVYTYNFQLENSLASSGVGVLCHEMSHSIGFPDLYHYSSNGISPVGRWDLMESNRNPPQHHTAYMKSFYGHWLPPMREITQSGTYWVNKSLIREDNCYMIRANNLQYFYVVEFRKKEGIFENSLPGTGMLISRIDTSEQGDGNADGPPDELYIYRPNGTLTYNGTINSANYSLETGRTAINENTNPSPFLADGSQGGLDITNIGSSAGDSISFYVNIQEPPPTDYDEGFESGDFNAYPWALSGDSDWFITDANPYEGTFCAQSGNINHLQSTSISLPVIVPTAGNVSFMKKVSTEANYDYLKFYIDDLQMGQWSGNSNWNYVQFPVSAGNHTFRWSYVKDQGVVSGSDCVWIDNIAFRWEDDSVLQPPNGITAESLTDDIGINLSWQPPDSTSAVLMGYRIFKDNVQFVDVDTTNLNYTDYNVLPNYTYSYYLKAFYTSPDGHSEATDTLSVLVTGTPIIPVLTSAEIIDTFSVLLQWMLPVTARGIIGYHIYRNGALIHTTDDAGSMEWTDEDLPYGQYSYQVASRYPTVNSDLSDSIVVNIQEPVSTEDQSAPPEVFGIHAVFPNPMRKNAMIEYYVDKDNAVNDISIYNLKGQKLRSLIIGKQKAGLHRIEWDGFDKNGKKAAAGLYVIRMKSGARISVNKVLVFN